MPDYKLDVYKDKRGDFRWRRTAENGEIVGASSEGYSSRKHCLANAERDTATDTWEFYR
ncbi:MAG: YegP family protein, partial [Aestuariivirga sp.]